MSKTITTEENFDNFENTIAEVVRTLRRNASKTLEMKRRTAKALEDAALFHSSGNFERCYSTNPGRLTTSLRCQTLPGSQSQGHSENKNVQRTMGQKSAGTLDSNPSGTKKVSSSRLKSIVFKTLDRIFQTKNAPALQSPTPTISKPEVPEKENLEGSTEDFFPTSFHTSMFQASCSTLDDVEMEEQNFLPDLEICSGVVSHTSSNSDEGDSWLYVEDPIRVQEVIMEDSLNRSYSKSKPKKCQDRATSNLESKEQIKRPRRYVKRSSVKDGESKIKRLYNERQKEAETIPPSILEKELALAAYHQKMNKVKPDSPMSSGNNEKRQVCCSSSLPNLLELSFGESAESLPDFNTNSFSRGIALQPSSTLIRDASSTEDDDDDASSTCTASSFSSMHVPEEVIATTTSQQRDNAVPMKSALCQDVYVMPITVPVIPSRDVRNIQGISNKEFEKISQNFIPGKEGSQNQMTVTSKQCKPSRNIKESIPKNEMKIVQDAFSWLDDEKENEYEGNDAKENIPTNKSPSASYNQVGNSFFSINESERNCSASILCSTLNSTVPPPPPLPPGAPPPPPPPMPLESTTDGTNTTPRNRLPLAVFTQPRTGIFNQLECIEIGEIDAKKLKEKFPLMNKKIDGFKTKQVASSETLKFQLNIELFLKKWDITGPKVEVLLASISTLNAKPDLIDMSCITTLPIPKEHDIEKIKQKLAQNGELEAAEDFLWKLNKIPHLNEKLMCIEFSLDFQESTQSVFRLLDIFTATCNALSTSRKFMKIIEVVMALMNSLNTDEGSKIYGFDIQSLSKLAAKSSEDGTTTLLHFLIEYILSHPSSTDSVDFYLDFTDLSTVSKVCLADFKGQCDSWKNSLSLYEQELKIMCGDCNDNNEDKSKLEFSIKFQRAATTVLTDLTEKIDAALLVFKSCKECYGLSNTAITETGFFESLSRFIADYRKIHGEVIKRNKWAQSRRPTRKSPPISSAIPVQKPTRPKRKSCNFNGASAIKSDNVPGTSSDMYPDELTKCVLEMCSSENKPTRVPNRRRKSQNIIDVI